MLTPGSVHGYRKVAVVELFLSCERGLQPPADPGRRIDDPTPARRPTDQSTSEILHRLETCELELQAARGYIKALECGLHTVIAAHPAPEAVAELWSHVLPEVADIHGAGATGAPLFDAALQQALSRLSDHIQGAVDRGNDGTHPA